MGTTISTLASKIACKQGILREKEIRKLATDCKILICRRERGSLQWEWICTCTKRGSRENED